MSIFIYLYEDFFTSFFITFLNCETLEERQRREIGVSKQFCSILHKSIYSNKINPLSKSKNKLYYCVLKRSNTNSISNSITSIAQALTSILVNVATNITTIVTTIF